ncbi:MAG: NACHT domain-containing protein [Moorea sp. SIO4A3]|nr:NACHT domain-containing protein [Moorena sp. SIO4A3]
MSEDKQGNQGASHFWTLIILKGSETLVIWLLLGMIFSKWDTLGTQKAIGSYIAQAESGGTASVNVTQQLTSPHLSNVERRNRSKILARVYSYWIKGLLESENSLYNVDAIELGFEYKPDAVIYPWEMVVQEYNTSDRKLDSNTSIFEIFEELNEELLILGEPGTGKTTMLLDLARTLIRRAQQDETFPIPVIFHLSFWSQNPISFHDWLIHELGERYSLSPKISKKWIENNQVLLLLDGLDEVKLEVRSSCIEAINFFRSNYGYLSLVICSRIKDYESLDSKLKLNGAIVIQPLTQENINNFLSAAGGQLSVLRQVLKVDSELRELAKIPLMLNIMVMVYRQASISELSLSNSEDKKTNLFASYVEQMFNRRGKETRYSPEKTVRWLTWLANKMSEHNQGIFFIENLQHNWLSTHHHKAHKWLSNILLKVLMSLITALSLGGYFGVIWGLISGLAVFLTCKLKPEDEEEVKIIGTLSWQWQAVKDNFIPVFKGESVWLVLLLCLSLLASKSLSTTLGIGLVLTVLSGLTNIFISGITGKDIEKKTRPNLGIFKSAFYSALVGTAKGLFMGFSGLLLALVANTTGMTTLSYVGCFFIWAICGFITGWLKYGGLTSFQHFTLRLLLWMDRLSPWNYAHFLDYATERILLYKVGGGYTFIHRLPMDYFASLEADNFSKETGLFSRWRLR